MTSTQYDLCVIGGGSGGVSCARASAALGAKVAIIEHRDLGGTCVNRGCVPKKFYVYASEYTQHFNNAMGFGWKTPNPSFTWSTLQKNVFKDIKRLNKVYERMLNESGVDLYSGKAHFTNEKTLQVGQKKITAKKFLIATGGYPFMPPVEGHEFAVTSDEVFHLKTLPKHIAIIGGGYIAVEFASIFRGLGCKVTIMIRRKELLNRFDDDIRAHVREEMCKKGIDLRCGTNVVRIEKTKKGKLLHCDQCSDILVDEVMFATGRLPNTQGLGLENTKVKTDKIGAIEVDKDHCTGSKNIYAIGDVTNRVNLTPVAIHEGRGFADTHFGKTKRTMDYDNIPTAVFCQPNIGTVGLSEEEARQRYKNVDIYRSIFRPMIYALGDIQERTLMKLVVDSKTDKVLGVHMVGPHAGEIIQGFGVALKAGATKAVFDRTVGIHPTSAEEMVTMRTKLT